MPRIASLLIAVAAIAGPAWAQVDPGLNAALQMRETEMMAQQDLARQRSIAIENQLSTLDAQVQTNQRLRELEARNLHPRLPAPAVPAHPARILPSSAYPSIPDASLAASRARIQAASRNRR